MAGGTLRDGYTHVRLDPARVIRACASLLAGEASYRALLFLGRAGANDVPALFEFTRASDTNERRSKLWIISRFLARLSRDPAARLSIIEEIQ